MLWKEGRPCVLGPHCSKPNVAAILSPRRDGWGQNGGYQTRLLYFADLESFCSTMQSLLKQQNKAACLWAVQQPPNIAAILSLPAGRDKMAAARQAASFAALERLHSTSEASEHCWKLLQCCAELVKAVKMKQFVPRPCGGDPNATILWLGLKHSHFWNCAPQKNHPSTLETIRPLQKVSGEKSVLLGGVGNRPQAWKTW